MTDILARIRSALSDRYAVERQIGQGGMATVFLAEDLKHGRKVAVKVLKPELAAALGGDRFSREIQIAARLQHPHILPLLDSGEAGGFLYYVMPFVEGQSLRERLTRTGELPVHDAVKILIEVVDALAHAHENGVVHRDIKPDNVMLSGRHALVTDFGVAKAVSEATGRQQKTTAGVAMGTPAYMAPEQAAADPNLDHRVDIYAIGCVAYELLTGGPPFDRMSPQETLAAHVTQAPDPVERRREAVPPALAAVIMKCLAKRPADRWQSAEALLAQLEPLSTPSGGTTPTQTRPIEAVGTTGTPPWRRPFLWAGAIGVVAIALLAGRITRPSAPDVQLGRRTQATLLPGIEVFPALSPDGSLLAYADDRFRLFVRQVEGGNPIPVARELSGPQAIPYWAPDGKSLSFTSTRGVELVPALGGTPRLLVPVTPGRLVIGWGWAPDGTALAFTRGDSLLSFAPDRELTRPLTVGELHSCVWSPDGRWIACALGNLGAILPGSGLANLAQSSIVVVSSRGGTVSSVTQDSASNASPAWLPDGTLLYASSREGGRDVYAVRLTSAGAAAERPRRITTGLNALSLTVSGVGTRLAYAAFTETSNVWSVPIPSGRVASVTQASPITSGNQIIELFDISPDGRWMAFDSDRSGNSDIYRMPLAGGEPQQLTRSPLNEFFPSWSPDGRELVFHAFRAGRRQIFTVPAEGGPTTAVLESPDQDQNAAWSKDGKAVYFLTNVQSPASQVRRVTRNPDGSWGPPEVWRRPQCRPDESPVGDIVVCAQINGAALLVRLNGDSIRLLVDPAAVRPQAGNGAWSIDGRTYYFVGADSISTNIYAVAVSGGAPRVIVRFDDPARPWHRYGFRVFRDRFYFTVGDRQSDIWVAELAVKP